MLSLDFFVPLRRYSERVATQMNEKITVNRAYKADVHNYAYKENWKSTAS